MVFLKVPEKNLIHVFLVDHGFLAVFKVLIQFLLPSTLGPLLCVTILSSN